MNIADDWWDMPFNSTYGGSKMNFPQQLLINYDLVIMFFSWKALSPIYIFMSIESTEIDKGCTFHFNSPTIDLPSLNFTSFLYSSLSSFRSFYLRSLYFACSILVSSSTFLSVLDGKYVMNPLALCEWCSINYAENIFS